VDVRGVAGDEHPASPHLRDYPAVDAETAEPERVANAVDGGARRATRALNSASTASSPRSSPEERAGAVAIRR